MKISAAVLEDSLNVATGDRLVTMVLTYHRYIHSEFMTHRVFSRNASSSRAIPIQKQLSMIQSHPAMPVEWGSNKPGMQAGELLDTSHMCEAQNEWILAMYDAVKHAKKLQELNVHKQIVNRLLEPFSFITVIVTGTEWSNFFELRISDLAQPEIRKLAEKMKKAMDASTPVNRQAYEYHLPFVTEEERSCLDDTTAMMVSSARCARVSYLNHDGLKPDIAKDLALAERLRSDKHASVFEHQAYANKVTGFNRNLKGWVPHRQIIGL